MRPIATPRSNLTYKLPSRGSAGDLPCERVPLADTTWVIDLPSSPEPIPVPGPGGHRVDVTDDDTGEKRGEITVIARPTRAAIRSAWQLTDDELVHIARTGLLELTIFGEPIPPVALAVIEPGDFTDYGWGPENEQPEPPISREHANAALGAMYAALVATITVQLGDGALAAAETADQVLPDAETWLNLWHESLAMTSRAADNAEDPDARPGEDARDPREAGA